MCPLGNTAASDVKIKAIFFDLDGVLIDACDWHYEALNRALEAVVNDCIERDEHESVFNGLTTQTKLGMLVKAGRITEEEIPKITELKQKYTIDVIKEHHKIHSLRDPQKIALLRLLRVDGIKVGCVTNSIRPSTELMLEYVGVWSEMDVVISNYDVRFPKPHPEGYWKAMSTFGVLPCETIIVEDSEKGFMAAEHAGAHLLKVKDSTEVTWRNIAEKIRKCEL